MSGRDDAELQRHVVIKMPVPTVLEDYDDELVRGIIETDYDNLGVWDKEASVEVVLE